MDTSTPDIAPPNRRYAEPPTRPAGRAWLWLVRLAGQARRQVLCRLRPGYIERQQARRRGDCRQCGACCHLTFRCPFWMANGLSETAIFVKP